MRPDASVHVLINRRKTYVPINGRKIYVPINGRKIYVPRSILVGDQVQIPTREYKHEITYLSRFCNFAVRRELASYGCNLDLQEVASYGCHLNGRTNRMLVWGPTNVKQGFLLVGVLV